MNDFSLYRMEGKPPREHLHVMKISGCETHILICNEHNEFQERERAMRNRQCFRLGRKGLGENAPIASSGIMTRHSIFFDQYKKSS